MNFGKFNLNDANGYVQLQSVTNFRVNEDDEAETKKKEQKKSPFDMMNNAEEYWKTQRKCLRCKKLYTEEENQSNEEKSVDCNEKANDKCFYHSGTYTDPDNIKEGTLVGWSCCNMIEEPTSFFKTLNQNALDYDSKGCKSARYHKEDIDYSNQLSNFPYCGESATKGDDNQKQEYKAVDLKELENVNYNQLPDHPHFFVHYVQFTDTLVGLSMKYNIPAAVIKRVNRLPTQQIFERKYLYIPKTSDHQYSISPDDDIRLDNDRIRMRFISETKVTKEEAIFYLEEVEYDYDKAIELFNEDMQWTRSQAMKSGPALNSISSQTPKGRSCFSKK